MEDWATFDDGRVVHRAHRIISLKETPLHFPLVVSCGVSWREGAEKFLGVAQLRVINSLNNSLGLGVIVNLPPHWRSCTTPTRLL